jgi:hypothetical protein
VMSIPSIIILGSGDASLSQSLYLPHFLVVYCSLGNIGRSVHVCAAARVTKVFTVNIQCPQSAQYLGEIKYFDFTEECKNQQ